jgi:hypothetical protein
MNAIEDILISHFTTGIPSKWEVRDRIASAYGINVIPEVCLDIPEFMEKHIQTWNVSAYKKYGTLFYKLDCIEDMPGYNYSYETMKELIKGSDRIKLTGEEGIGDKSLCFRVKFDLPVEDLSSLFHE